MRLHGPPGPGAKLVLEEVPEGAPGPGEIRVRVSACGVCRTDLHLVAGELVPRRLPIVPGHQAVGRVEARGEGAVRFAPGERVGIAWLRSTCGACDDCRRGGENLCSASRYSGWDEDGGFAETAVVREDFAYRLPPSLADAEAAPLLCAGIIGWRALRRSGIQAGGRLGLYGFGSSAHLALQLARARGCEVHVVTRGDRHRRLALALGAAWAGEAAEGPPVELDAAILFAPAGSLVAPALAALRRGGTLACAGIHLSEIPPLDYGRHLFHEKTLTSVASHTRSDGEELMAEAARIGLRPRVRVFALGEANRALAELRAGGIDGSAVLDCTVPA